MKQEDNVNKSNNGLPNHIAIIMDGNGRWARRQGLPRSEGHRRGVDALHRTTRLVSDLGIKYLTVYAFSTENWNRPQQEVDTLMYLIGWAIKKETAELVRNNVRLRLIGAIDRLPEATRSLLEEGCRETSHCTGLTLSLCLSYSSRWEICEAARRLCRETAQGSLNPDNIDDNIFAGKLNTAGLPDPDLLIRTGGEHRISNFMLWQIAYSELFFSDVLWPDFDEAALMDAISDFRKRERRFGMTSEQVSSDISS